MATVKESNLLWVTWKEFWSSTGIAGLSNSASAATPQRKFAWLLVLAAMIGMTCFSLNNWIGNWNSTTTSAKTISQSSMDFPAVTVCNQNRVHCGRLKMLIAEKLAESSQLNFTEAHSILEKENYSGAEADALAEYTPFLEDAGCMINFNRYDEADLDGGSYGQGKQSATTQRELKFLNSYLSIHRDNRIQIGHQLGDFIKSCTFGGLECTVDNRTFVLWDSPSYGNCYSFNFDVNSLLKHVEEKPSKSVALPGPGHGLNLVFNIEQEHYGGITETEGVRVVIHARDKFPSIDEAGINVEPNTATDIAMEHVLTKREPAPYGHCTSNWTLEGMGDYGRGMTEKLFWILGYIPPYSQELCLRNCFFLAFAEEAKCANFEVASVPDVQQKITDHICDLTTEGPDYKTIRRVMDQFENGTKACPCHPTCLEETFPATISSVRWPSEKYQATAANSYCADCKDPAKNLIKINIFYANLNEHKIEDRIDYAVQDGSLFNALGGCLSLWLGVSFCNLFEILELLLDFVGNFINQLLGREIGRATNPI